MTLRGNSLFARRYPDRLLTALLKDVAAALVAWTREGGVMSTESLISREEVLGGLTGRVVKRVGGLLVLIEEVRLAKGGDMTIPQCCGITSR